MAAPSVVAHAASYGPALGVTVPAAIVGGALVGFGTRMGNGWCVRMLRACVRACVSCVHAFAPISVFFFFF